MYGHFIINFLIYLDAAPPALHEPTAPLLLPGGERLIYTYNLLVVDLNLRQCEERKHLGMRLLIMQFIPLPNAARVLRASPQPHLQLLVLLVVLRPPLQQQRKWDLYFHFIYLTFAHILYSPAINSTLRYIQ